MNKYFLFLILCVISVIGFSYNSEAGTYKKITLIIGDSATIIEAKVAHLLIDRVEEMGLSTLLIESAKYHIPSNSDELQVVFGIPQNNNILSRQFATHRIPELTEIAPGPEGFLLQMISSPKKHMLLAAGIDERGCLYVVGEILRQMQIREGIVYLSDELYLRTAPAFEIRGTQYGQSHVAKNLAHVRDWTEEETQRVILDYALAGANIFDTSPGSMFDFIKSYGLMTQGRFGANTGGRNLPSEWNAAESIGRLGYVCLSVPAARKYMLEKCEEEFRNSPTYDLVKFHGGDGGGCECDRCDPYGLTFIKTVEEMARIIHKYHPATRIFFTNQKFDNDDDNAIFGYLQEKPRDWLWAWGYGPGSDATTWQPGHRQTHRMDLFRYPGFGPYGLYPKEILHQLPSRHDLVYFNEITHWKYAQHAFIQMYPRADRRGDLPPHWSHEIYERRPDQFLTMVYNRLTFYAWPKYYHRVFIDLMPYGVGDITHSSGHHDHFNQWMWQRLLWSPRMTVEDVLIEYCITWFGHETVPEMVEAILQLEENLEENPEVSLPEKEGIDLYYDLVKTAGQKMAPEIMEKNWLWRMYMQKAVLDKYVQLAVRQQFDLRKQIEGRIAANMGGSQIDQVLTEVLSWINQQKETKEMSDLHDEADHLGKESNRIFGVRNDGLFNLKHDFIGLGWLKRQIKRAMESQEQEKDELLKMIVDYENAGEGGYYDNLGTFNHAPHVISGYPYDHGQPYVSQMLSEGNRPSQRSMHFTQDEKQGVTLKYEDLDPSAQYRIRFTFVRPWYQERYAHRMNQRSQTIYVDDHVLVENLELPIQMSDFATFDIPQHVTKNGELTVRLEKSSDVAAGDRVTVEQWRNSGGWGTIVSEVWLIKKGGGSPETGDR